MKVTANIATYPGRINALKQMIPSIIDQFDEVRICLNEYTKVPQFLIHDKIHCAIPDENLTDNGKFLFAQNNKEIYCTLDDDILYPNNYREVIEEAIKDNPDNVYTFHGRQLSGSHKNYYKAPHKVFRCFGLQKKKELVDVAGTGVSAFIPFGELDKIVSSKFQKMSDILFSLECAFRGKKIVCLPHTQGYFQPIKINESIYNEMVENDYIQAVLCQRIFELNTKK